MILLSIVLFVLDSPSLFLVNSINSINESLSLCFSLCAIYVFWVAILNICKVAQIDIILSKILSPLIYLIFGKVDKKAKSLITLNVSANILGLGNASVPFGVQAMEKLNENNKTDKPTKSMVMLFVLNCCSLQLLPTTIITLRNVAGDSNSTKIILPIWIVSILCCTLAVFLVKIFYKKEK